MNVLKGLKPEARRLLTEAFRRGEQPTVDSAEYVVDLKAELGREIDLAPLRVVVEEAMRRFDGELLKSDAWLGPRVHATLRLTRREAADKRIWSYLAISSFPKYVYWRWEQNEINLPVAAYRYLGDENQSAFAKLWWAAELVRNGPSYMDVTKALSINRFYQWQSLQFIHHKPAAIAAARVLSNFSATGATRDQAVELYKLVNLALRTKSLDDFSDNVSPDIHSVREWINERIDVTAMLEDLPVGPDEAPVPEGDIAKVRAFLDELAVRVKLAEAKPRKKGRAVAV